MHITRSIIALLVLSSLAACSSSQKASSPYETPSAESRDPRKADQLNAKAADLLQSKPLEAERILREALAADLYHGPAHNNLGVLYLGQGKLYEAASEFEWARRLLPGHPDPRINLGAVYERAGRNDEALASYQSALEVYPEHLQAMESLVKLQLRVSKTDELTERRLAEIALRGETEQWREWAKMQRAKLSR